MGGRAPCAIFEKRRRGRLLGCRTKIRSAILIPLKARREEGRRLRENGCPGFAAGVRLPHYDGRHALAREFAMRLGWRKIDIRADSPTVNFWDHKDRAFLEGSA